MKERIYYTGDGEVEELIKSSEAIQKLCRCTKPFQLPGLSKQRCYYQNLGAEVGTLNVAFYNMEESGLAGNAGRGGRR